MRKCLVRIARLDRLEEKYGGGESRPVPIIAVILGETRKAMDREISIFIDRQKPEPGIIPRFIFIVPHFDGTGKVWKYPEPEKIELTPEVLEAKSEAELDSMLDDLRGKKSGGPET